ncbi:PucR family transcriptional regulator [Streptomyces solincola]|uniref:PucR family transcriptional regulator n=1 Tax=Streptomyces solincola TaxID=2100817 RepID=UPI002159914C|nr:PucR family transcriptional regulator [Streptomyces solincola]
MHVGHLLQLHGLELDLVWAERELLTREIGGVTATDLEDPARFLQRGEIVLSGLVWWAPGDGRDKIDRFVSALRTAEVSALLAGEETHGEVPAELAASCRDHRVALLAVPARTTFRAVTEAVYLRQWGDLSRRPSTHHALPGTLRGELDKLVDQGAGPGELLRSAFAHLGSLPGCVLTATGRTVARTPGAQPLPPDRAAAVVRAPHGGSGTEGTTLRVPDEAATAYDTWYLHVPGGVEVPPRALHEIADVLGRYRRVLGVRGTARRRAAAELVRLLASGAPDPEALDAALAAAGLPTTGPYRLLVAEAADPEPWPPAAQTDPAGPGEARTEAARAQTRTEAGAGAQWRVGAPAGAWTEAEALAEGAAAVARADQGAGGPARPVAAEGALAEVLAYLDPVGYAVAPAERGEVVAVVRCDPDAAGAEPARLAALWPLVLAARPVVPLHAGLSVPAAAAAALPAALAQARYARDAARVLGPGAGCVTAGDELSSLATLLAGVPAGVRETFAERTLGPLGDQDSSAHAILLRTLEVFLAHNCSWARTAEALHLHVNTVHYRIQRIQALTGRDLTKLDDKLDLYAALLCR